MRVEISHIERTWPAGAWYVIAQAWQGRRYVGSVDSVYYGYSKRDAIAMTKRKARQQYAG